MKLHELTADCKAALRKLLRGLQSAQDAYNSLSPGDEFNCMTLGGYEAQIEAANQIYIKHVGALPTAK